MDTASRAYDLAKFVDVKRKQHGPNGENRNYVIPAKYSVGVTDPAIDLAERWVGALTASDSGALRGNVLEGFVGELNALYGDESKEIRRIGTKLGTKAVVAYLLCPAGFLDNDLKFKYRLKVAATKAGADEITKANVARNVIYNSKDVFEDGAAGYSTIVDNAHTNGIIPWAVELNGVKDARDVIRSTSQRRTIDDMYRLDMSFCFGKLNNTFKWGDECIESYVTSSMAYAKRYLPGNNDTDLVPTILSLITSSDLVPIVRDSQLANMIMSIVSKDNVKNYVDYHTDFGIAEGLVREHYMDPERSGPRLWDLMTRMEFKAGDPVENLNSREEYYAEYCEAVKLANLGLPTEMVAARTISADKRCIRAMTDVTHEAIEDVVDGVCRERKWKQFRFDRWPEKLLSSMFGLTQLGFSVRKSYEQNHQSTWKDTNEAIKSGIRTSHPTPIWDFATPMVAPIEPL